MLSIRLQNSSLTMFLGVLVGMFIGVGLVIIIKKVTPVLLVWIWACVTAHQQQRSDVKNLKMAKKISEMTGSEVNPMLKKKHYHELLKKRAFSKRKMSPSLNDDFKSLSESQNHIEMILKSSEATDESISEPKTAKGSGKIYPKILTMSVAIMALFLSCNVNGCDMNFYFQTEGKICNTMSCYDMNMYTFPIVHGQEICFQSYDGEVTNIKIEEAYERIRSGMIYKTTNYSINMETNWVCESKDECSRKVCKPGSKHYSFTNYNKADNFMCKTSSDPCDTYCFWGGQCVYYHQWVERSEVLYPVYETISKIWEVVLSIDNGVTKNRVVANVNNPSVHMKIKANEMTSVINIPMYISGLDY